jgi:hypothetical protein
LAQLTCCHLNLLFDKASPLLHIGGNPGEFDGTCS